jgi:uncharacterized membrane protein
MLRIVCAAGLAASPALAQSSFSYVPALPGALGVRIATLSRDGRYVVGACDLAPQGSRAFRWLVGSGAAESLNIPPEYLSQEPNCVTATGSVISGQCRSATQSLGFRWSTGGFTTYGFLPGCNASSVYAISDTGQSATGISYDLLTGYGQPFLCSGGQTLQGLNNLPGGNLGVGLGMSADGSVIVGSSGTAANQRAFRWTSANGLQQLPELPGQDESAATVVSIDGSTVAGRSGDTPFRWTAAGGVQSLGALPDMIGHEPCAMSSEGSVIAGIATDLDGNHFGWVWTAAGGIQFAEAYLAANGIVLPAVRITDVSGVSADGTRLAGNSIQGGWVAHLAAPCGANCDGSTSAPVLNVLDFNCFLNRFSAGEPSANCDGSTSSPVLNVLDFNCFLNRFSAGCP